MADRLHVPPAPDGFSHESPIRAFTDWSVNGRYAIGKGFRPSLAHVTVYLDAMERKEGWSLLQILEASTGSPSFVFHKVEQAPSDVEILLSRLDEFSRELTDPDMATLFFGHVSPAMARCLRKEP